MFAKYSISSRLGLLTVFTSMIGVLAAGYALLQLRQLETETNFTIQVLQPQLSRISQAELTLTRISLQARHAILARDAGERDATFAEIGRLGKQLESLMAEFDRNTTSAKGGELFAIVKFGKTEFWSEAGAVVKLVQDDKKPEAFARLVDKVVPARDRWLKAMADQREWQETGLARAKSTAIDTARLAQSVLVSLLCMILGTGLAQFLLTRHLLTRRARLAAAQADQVAAGDLTAVPMDEQRDEFTPVFDALGGMRGSLSKLVAQVRSGVDSVTSASAQIASGNQDLSNRTEQQASSLQHTASSMEQLTGTVQQSAAHAHEANQLAAQASAAARRGGEVVANVVSTMEEINSSSRRIAEIVGVIDGIAFQTNILALNAAVEAARAGEQGRGFAVVASEVRSLAQRSAGAAQEIKAMISNSVEKVETGSAQVSDAGVAMKDIVEQVSRVTSLISEITAAAAEQSSDIGTVNQAVSQMDHNTQQNAALVEQSAAAAESLRQQAQRLAETVGVFKLEQAAV